MHTFLQQLVNGLTIGSVYALIALGYNLIFGVLNVLSFAHGALVMVGSYSMFFLLTLVGVNFYLAILAGIACATMMGLVVERIAVRPILPRSEWGVIVATIGAGLFIQFMVRRFTSGRPESFPVPFEPTYYTLWWGIQVSDMQFLLMMSGLALMILLVLLVYRTKFGFAMRAVAQSPDIASTLGINRFRIGILTFAIASAVAGASGILYSIHYNVTDVFMGVTLGLKGMVIVIVAGVGNLPGCLVVGLLLATIEVMVVGYWQSTLRDFVGYAALVLILLVRPGGLFGEHGRADYGVR